MHHPLQAAEQASRRDLQQQQSALQAARQQALEQQSIEGNLRQQVPQCAEAGIMPYSQRMAPCPPTRIGTALGLQWEHAGLVIAALGSARALTLP